MKKIPFIGIFITISLSLNSFGQISKGGIPLSFSKLKSAHAAIPIIKMPEVTSNQLKTQSIEEGKRLKSYPFAHSFQVDITPQNNGKWSSVNGYNIWQVGIYSEGAYSLNVIFDKYKLPEGAKLFLCNGTRTKTFGAFTSENNKPSGILAATPVAGDLIYIEYEEPNNASFKGELKIGTVNHDYKNIFGASYRRPLGESESCNPDVNCPVGQEWHKEKRATTRLIVNGNELCTGVLVSNTLEDKTPYLLTANHCIENSEEATKTLLYFNYESPNCNKLDGIAEQQISSTEYIAGAADLDFTLVKLSVYPPAEYQPYLAGWSRDDSPPSSSVCIHHPKGDVKKIAIDNQQGEFDYFSNDFYDGFEGFIKVLSWEEGTTEGGSSGAPLFNPLGQVTGTLTGGEATCSHSVNDYFTRFQLVWDWYDNEPLKSLKEHLDPIGSDPTSLNGEEMYTGTDRIYALSNFSNEELNLSGAIPEGYLAGHNTSGATEFVEEFNGYESVLLHGVSLGFSVIESSSRMKIKVYEGPDGPESLVHEVEILPTNYEADAMNYISFANPVFIEGKFYVGFEIYYDSPSDTIAAFVAEKRLNENNSAWAKIGTDWIPFNSNDYFNYPTSLFIEVWASGLKDTTSIPPPVPYQQENFIVYPNPVIEDYVTVELPDHIDGKIDLELYDIQGNTLDYVNITNPQAPFELQLKGLSSGIYLLSVKSDNYWKTLKIIITHTK